jgi:predicted RNA binding protein YcfA (HicA-like mRNA interferase family)
MCRVLKRHGWAIDHIRGSHHSFRKAGHPLPVVVPVHAGKDLPPGTQRNIMRMAGLTDADL